MHGGRCVGQVALDRFLLIEQHEVDHAIDLERGLTHDAHPDLSAFASDQVTEKTPGLRLLPGGQLIRIPRHGRWGQAEYSTRRSAPVSPGFMCTPAEPREQRCSARKG